MNVVVFKHVENLLSWLRGDEKYLVVELFRHGIRATPIFVDLKGRKLRLREPYIGTLESDLPAFFKRVKNLDSYCIVVSLDSDIATTVHSSVALVRENKDAVIDEADLDNVISGAIWKFFDRQRNAAAAKMNVADVDVVLGDVKIWDVKLDGHRVLNPVGFQARAVEVQLSETFMPRNWLALLESALPMDAVVLTSEAASSWARVVGKFAAEDSFLVAGLLPHHTIVSAKDKDRVAYCDAFDWGERDFIAGLAKQFSVTQGIARYIATAADAPHASPHFRKKAGALVEAELRLGLYGLQRIAGASDARALHVVPFYDVPPVFLAMSLRNKADRPLKLRMISTKIVSENFGFALQLKADTPDYIFTGAITAFFDAYLSPRQELSNAIAKRRVRWLVKS